MTANIENKQRLGRQRIAWTILLSSFTVCMVLTIAVPLLINVAIQRSTEPLNIFVQSNQGTVAIDDASGNRQAIIAGDIGGTAASGQSMRTGNTATGLMSISIPNSEDVLARLQVYSNSEVQIEAATTPLFALSSQDNQLNLRMDNGRVRLNVPPNTQRPTNIQIATPQGTIQITQPGEFTVVVTTENTQLTVQEGTAELVADADNDNGEQGRLQLIANQRGEIPTGSGPVGPLETARNLIKNGDFNDGLGEWTQFPWTVEIPTEPDGQIRVLNEGGESRLNVTRRGTGHADILMRQNIGQDVSELDSLRILVTFRILQQSLEVCGIVGSECPLFIRVNYIEEESGFSNTWQQGFFGHGEASPTLPDICQLCAMVQSTHESIPVQQDAFFEIDLREELLRQGRRPPQFIESIVLVFSGHEFEVEVVDVALIAED